MRIAYYSNVFFTDCDFPLIREFQNQGHRAFYFINIYKGQTSGGLFSSVKCPGFGIFSANELQEFSRFREYMDLENTYIVYRSQRWFNPINIWITFQLMLLLLKNKVEVINVTYALGISEFMLYMFRHIMVMTVHDPFTHSGEGSSYGELKRRFSYYLARKLVLLNESQLNDFVEFYHLSKSKKILLNNLGCYDCLKYLQSKLVGKSYLDYSYILFFGHFSPYKGIDVLCDAMKKVHSFLPDLKCIIAGRGHLNFDIQPYLEDGYIILKHHFIEIDELAELISGAIFVVCPYKDATQSGVVASSFALEKPVLATNTGGLPETVKDGVCGRIVPPSNILSLSEAIINMVTSPHLLRIYSKNISQLYESGDKSWREIAKKYIVFYNR